MSQYLDYGMRGGGISTNEYSKYLDDNQKVPTQKRNLQLYHWISRQKKLLHEGCLPKERRDPLEKLLARIDSIRERQAVEANSTWTATPTGERESLNCTLAASDACQAERVERQPVRQDDLWNQKWRAYMDYMEKYKRRPSKHRTEDLVLFDWFKHSKKLLKRGLMKAERITKFKQLLSEAENLSRTNQFNYSDTFLKS